MSDEQRKAIALEYLRRLDCGEVFFDLFDDYVAGFEGRTKELAPTLA